VTISNIPSLVRSMSCHFVTIFLVSNVLISLALTNTYKLKSQQKHFSQLISVESRNWTFQHLVCLLNRRIQRGVGGRGVYAGSQTSKLFLSVSVVVWLRFLAILTKRKRKRSKIDGTFHGLITKNCFCCRSSAPDLAWELTSLPQTLKLDFMDWLIE